MLNDFFCCSKESNRKPQQTASNPIDPLRSTLTARGPSPIPSPSTARKTATGEANPLALENGSQLSQSAPDLRLGFRHVRSASQPSGTSTTSHRESFSSVTFPDRSNSVNSDTGYYNETAEEPMILQEDIIALTCHVRKFSEALSSLRNTFIECEGKNVYKGALPVVYLFIVSSHSFEIVNLVHKL